MNRLSDHQITMMFLSLGILLTTARVLAEVARRFNQPGVLGELLAGLVLGPTLLGNFAPGLTAELFPKDGPLAFFFHGFNTLAISLFLLGAGMEVDLSTVWRQGRSAVIVGLFGILVPSGMALILAGTFPTLVGRSPESSTLAFALFLAIAMSISALPVIAKTLMDLNIYRSDVGMIVIAAAVFDDLVGWLSFALVTGLMGSSHGAPRMPLYWTFALTILFAVFVLTVVRVGIDRVLPWIQAHLSWPAGPLGFYFGLGLLSAAFTEWIGVHAIFGAFLVGVAIGDSGHVREHTRAIIHQFVSFIFAPLFFAGVGLRFNFLANFDVGLTLIILALACTAKIVGCGFGAMVSGLGRREALAVGFAMNARGAMEIILGLLALESGLIDQRMFVTLFVVAIVTSMLSGPMMRKILRLRRPRKLGDFITLQTLLLPMGARTKDQAIHELVNAVAVQDGMDAGSISRAVLAREAQGPTGLGDRIAVPHARLDSIERPIVALGVSHDGIDFNSPDGMPAHLVFLLLTPRHDNGAQVELLADIARTFSGEETREHALQVASYTEFRALLSTQAPRTH